MQAGVPEVRQPPFDGPANHVRQVIMELKKLGHQVRLVARFNGKIFKSDDLEYYEPIIISRMDRGPIRQIERIVRRIQYEFQLPFFSFFDSLRFASACQQELADCDLLYERIGWVAYGGSIAARKLKISHVLEENGDHLSVMDTLGNAPQGVQRRLEESLMKRSIMKADHIVAGADLSKEYFIQQWGVNSDKVSTIYNGTELVEILQRGQLRSFNNAENPDQSTTVAYIGGFYPWHGVTILIRACAHAIQNGANLKLVLMGSGSGMEEAKQLVDDMDIANYVMFTGRLTVHEYAPFLAEADIGVSPYCGWFEYTGLKLLDYKAAGLPTIASGENGQPTMIQHEHNGWIVPPCDESALVDAILRLSTDVKLRKRMGRAARVEAEQNHGWNQTAKCLGQLFYEVLENSS